MQIFWYNGACKLPCKNPYFIAKIRVRVCEIEWTLTTNKLTGLLLRGYASIKNWIEDGLISSASGETPAARTPDQIRVTFSVREVFDEAADLQNWYPSRAGENAWYMRNFWALGRLANRSREAATHAPLILESLITATDEHGRIW